MEEKTIKTNENHEKTTINDCKFSKGEAKKDHKTKGEKRG